MIELAVLGLLKDEDLHGYELKKQLTDLLGPWSSVSFGSLYPALSRLERDGRVEAVTASELGDRRLSMPMTGALSGEVAAFRALRAPARGSRNKKVYAITDAGERRLVELLAEATPTDKKAGDDRLFALRVAFCRHLASDQRLDLFERRRTEVARRLAERQDTGGRTLDRYLGSLRDHDARSLTYDLEWLDQLIADERTAIAAMARTEPEARVS